MPTTYQRATKDILDMANGLLREFVTHKPLLDAEVSIDILTAHCGRDEESGEIIGECALKLHGARALGIARIMPLKQRAAGRGDAEICLDGDWWHDANEDERRALLDHELHHLAIRTDRKGAMVLSDDLGRPKLRMRKHDYQFGWFEIIANRHEASQERLQAKFMMENSGQFFWPEMGRGDSEKPTISKPLAKALSGLAKTVADAGASMTLSTGDRSVTIGAKAAKSMQQNCEAIVAGNA